LPWRGAPEAPLDVLEAAEARMSEATFSGRMSFEGAKLYSYMNGAAETYYAKGFEVLGTADAKWRNTEAKIELYRVNSAANAKALFDESDDGTGKPLAAGVASTSWSNHEIYGIFHRGPFFCRVIVYGNDAEARQLLQTLAQAIDQAIAR
jgi:hypothetical protein